MLLHEEFESSGNWLFRWRSFLPVLGFVFVLLAFRQYHFPGHSEATDREWECFCLAVSLFGLFIRAYTIGHTPKRTSGRNTKTQVADTLNTTGAYSLVRNPLYLGNFFMGLGIAMFAFFWWLALIYALLFWLYYERIIFAEEAFLKEKFGALYIEWARKTPVFVPLFKNFTKPTLPFSFKNVLRREYNGFFAVIACMFGLEVLSDWVVEGHIEFDADWTIGLAFSALVWLTLRTLKRKTRLLNVDER